MNENIDPVIVLDADECMKRLRNQELGRIVTHVGETIDIFPVNYVVDGDSVLFRTAPGSKLFELTVNTDVLFQVDDHTDVDAWSVIVRGHARALDTDAEIERAEQAGLRPWVPTLKRVFVRVTPVAITGRAFHRGPEPERSGVAEY